MSLSRFGRFAAPALLIALLAATGAHASDSDSDTIFDAGIGAGIATSSNNSALPPQAVIKIETNYCKAVMSNFCVVIGRGTATGTVGSGGSIGSLNLNYDVVGGEFDLNQDQSLVAGASLFSVQIERNVAIDEDHFIRLTFAGFRAQGKLEVTPDLEIFAKASVDALGLAYAQTIAKNRDISGVSQSGSVEIGAVIAKRIHVSLREQLAVVTGASNIQIPEGTVTTAANGTVTTTGSVSCIYQSNTAKGTTSQVCTPLDQAAPASQVWSSVTELSATVDIAKHLQLFATGSYSYFFESGDPSADSTTVPAGDGEGVIMGEIGLELTI